jgi:hypothetical protein
VVAKIVYFVFFAVAKVIEKVTGKTIFLPGD